MIIIFYCRNSTDLTQEIEDAFCTGSSVLPSFRILDPHNLPDTVQDLLDYNQLWPLICHCNQSNPNNKICFIVLQRDFNFRNTLGFFQESINRLVEFYGTAKGDTFQGHRVQVRA